MGIQFDSITTAPESSLSLIIEDITRKPNTVDLEAWLNALLRQSTPLISSISGRAQLEAWLEAVDLGQSPA